MHENVVSLFDRTPALPLISVALATFNGAKYIGPQLDSIYSQSYPNVEVVVSDDGSSDGTLDILERYKAERGLKLIKQKRRLGYKDNFVEAIKACSGEFIALADQDDLWVSNKLEILHDEIGVDFLIHADVKMIDEDGLLIAQSARHMNFGDLHDRVFLDRDYHRRSVLTRKSLCQGCTTLFRSTLLETALPIPAAEQAHDIWLAFVAAAQDKIRYVDVALVSWRLHGSNTSQIADKSEMKRSLKGSFIHGLYRRQQYYRRAIVLKIRGISMSLYPLRLRDEIF